MTTVVEFQSHPCAPMQPTERQVALSAFRAAVPHVAARAIGETITKSLACEPLCGKLIYDDILPILASEIRRQLDEVCGSAEATG